MTENITGPITVNGKTVAEEGKNTNGTVHLEDGHVIEVTNHQTGDYASVKVGFRSSTSTQTMFPNGRPRDLNGVTVVHESE